MQSVKIAWLREDVAFMPVDPTALLPRPSSYAALSPGHDTALFVRPATKGPSVGCSRTRRPLGVPGDGGGVVVRGDDVFCCRGLLGDRTRPSWGSNAASIWRDDWYHCRSW